MKRGAGGWRTESEERNRASVDNVGERGRNERWHRGGDGDGEGEQTGTCTLITYSPLFPLVLSLSISLSLSRFFLPFFSSSGSNVCTLLYTRVSDCTWAVCLMVSRYGAVVRHEPRSVRRVYAAGSYPSAIREISHEDIRAPLPKENVLATARYLSSARPDTFGYLNACTICGKKETERESRCNEMRKYNMEKGSGIKYNSNDLGKKTRVCRLFICIFA